MKDPKAPRDPENPSDPEVESYFYDEFHGSDLRGLAGMNQREQEELLLMSGTLNRTQRKAIKARRKAREQAIKARRKALEQAKKQGKQE